MSELLLDVSRLVIRKMQGRLPTGIDRVMLAYVRHYAPSAKAVVGRSGATLVLTRQGSEDVFGWLLDRTSRNPMKAVLSNPFRSGRRPAEDSILLNAGHTGLDSAGYARMLMRRRTRPLFVIHDLIPITHPQFCRAGEPERHRARMETALSLASGIVCNSRMTLDELSNHCRLLGHEPPEMVCAPLATEGQNKAEAVIDGQAPAGRAAPYFVFVGTIEPRKNHTMVLQIWERLAGSLGKRVPHLYLIGQRGWECEHVVRLLERNPKLSGCVTELGKCDDKAMNSLLHGARALLFPTFAEGYGMPIIEALARGVPVIASDLPVFREFAGDIPEYIDCLDSMRWMQTIEDYTQSDSVRRTNQLQRMRGFHAPTWSSHFKQVDALIDRIRSMPRRNAGHS